MNRKLWTETILVGLFPSVDWTETMSEWMSPYVDTPVTVLVGERPQIFSPLQPCEPKSEHWDEAQRAGFEVDET
jgi:hypothetical protein